MSNTVGKVVAAAVLLIVALMTLNVVLGAVAGVVRLGIFVFSVVAFADAMVRQTSLGRKAIWGALILFVPVVGALAYFVVVPRPRLTAGTR